jgi:hypothetical protein
VGYGVTAPEFDYDDYAGLDVRGKIVVLLRGAPARFPHNERAYYSDQDVKVRNAVARGAIGVLGLRTPEASARVTWEKSVALSRIPSLRWLTPGGDVVEGYPEIRVGATLSDEGAAAVPGRLTRWKSSPGPGEPASPSTCRLRSPSASGADTSLGCERGRSPSRIGSHLRSEVVVYTAHLDHLGVDPLRDGDRIYNGAYDNASGRE